eukprot:TRINITY_DN46083_c0_g1_i1.p2 TRINITY_DN46083_c0_g1~~TRINITY_DN46083_c0_g1_i1.p2  ORF type:complete len:134 (-),score=25.30 TRINITY_DN46083_c0_g1_i1:8-409(-)
MTIKKLYQHYAQGILLSLNNKGKEKCKEYIKTKYFNIEMDYHLIIDSCRRVKFSYDIDVWSTLKKDLKQFQGQEEENQKIMEMYIKMRKNKKLPFNNIKILQEFSKIYSDTAQTFLQKISHFLQEEQEIQQSL